MVAFNKYQVAAEHLAENSNAATDVWKIALSLTVNATDTAFVVGTTDLPTAGGYVAGGKVCATVSSSQTSGIYKLVLSDPAAWMATGVGFTFRYAVLYNSTTLVPIGYWDYGANLVLNGTNFDSFQITLDAVNGVFSIN